MADTVDKTTDEIKNIGSYFSEISNVFVEQYEKKGLRKHTKLFLDYFEKIDLKELTVLELGCGVGGLLLTFLDLGAKHAFGVDLSEKMIENAKNYAKLNQYAEKTNFFIGDFNTVKADIIPVNQADIVIADRVLCCSPVPLEILVNMIGFKPKYMVVVQPRKNIFYRGFMDVRRMWLRFRLRVQTQRVKIPYVEVKKYDKICNQHGFVKVMKRFRYGWEVVIYQKT